MTDGDRPANAADEAKLRASAKKLKDQRNQEQNDIREIMARPEGRRLMWRIISEGGVFSDCFTGNNTTFFNEGKRSNGLWLMNELETTDQANFIEMWKENGFTHG